MIFLHKILDGLIFKQLYTFVQESDISTEISHELFQRFKETLTEERFIKFMKKLFLKIDAIEKTERRKYLASILRNISVSSIRRFLYEHCPLFEKVLRETDFSTIIDALENRELISERFLIKTLAYLNYTPFLT